MLNRLPKVSILIPVYNRVDLIRETVDSALAQTFQDFEVVIADNCSTDGTWEILQEYAEKDEKIRLVRNSSNIGPVRNWKRCIDSASGEYGKILWSDDLITPDFLEKTLPFLEDAPDAGFVITGIEIFSSEEHWRNPYVLGCTGYRDSEEFIRGSLLGGSYPVSPGCALFRLPDLKKNLLVDIPNKAGSDFAMHAIGNDLLVFLLTANDYPRFAYISDKISLFRAHSGSITISSKGGRIPIHYNMVKAYFAENYRKDLIPDLNAAFLLFLIRSKDHKNFGIHNISDFYFSLDFASVNWGIFVRELWRKIKNRLIRAVRQLQI